MSPDSSLVHLLEEDHARLDTLLRAAIADEQEFNHAAFEAFRSGLLRHIGLEEKWLLPWARRRSGKALPIATVLRREHAALASLLVPTPDAALAREILALLAEHNLREEGPEGLYRECACLAPEEADALAERMRVVPPPPLARHFDGPGTVRTAAEALRAADRAAARRKGRA